MPVIAAQHTQRIDNRHATIISRQLTSIMLLLLLMMMIFYRALKN